MKKWGKAGKRFLSQFEEKLASSGEDSDDGGEGEDLSGLPALADEDEDSSDDDDEDDEDDDDDDEDDDEEDDLVMDHDDYDELFSVQPARRKNKPPPFKAGDEFVEPL